MSGDFFELRIGTPNELRLVKRGKLAQCNTALTTHLKAHRKQAERYDRSALSEIEYVRGEMHRLWPTSLKPGEKRSWRYSYMGVVVVVEITKTI